jgi:hypothetical protein
LLFGGAMQNYYYDLHAHVFNCHVSTWLETKIHPYVWLSSRHMTGNKNSDKTKWWIKVKGKCPQLHSFSCMCKSIGTNTMCWRNQLSFIFSMVVHEYVICNTISWFLAKDISMQLVCFIWLEVVVSSNLCSNSTTNF